MVVDWKMICQQKHQITKEYNLGAKIIPDYLIIIIEH